MRDENTVRVVMMGAAAVGKTSLVNRFVSGQVPTKYRPTIEDNYYFQFQDSLEKTFTFDILDTSGTYNFPAMKRLAISKAKIFFLVFSVSDEASFEQVVDLKDEILATRKDDSVKIYIIGNKIDERCDLSEEVKNRINSWGFDYTETSAVDNIGIIETFSKCIPNNIYTELSSYCQMPKHKQKKHWGRIPAGIYATYSNDSLKKSKSQYNAECSIL